MELNSDAIKLKKMFDKAKTKKVPKKVDLEVINKSTEVTKEEKLAEYFTFLRNLPILPDIERDRLINLVKEEWQIDDLLEHPINPENLVNIRNGGNLIERLSTNLGQSLKIIAPPVKKCLLCKESLSMNNKPAQIAVQ